MNINLKIVFIAVIVVGFAILTYQLIKLFTREKRKTAVRQMYDIVADPETSKLSLEDATIEEKFKEAGNPLGLNSQRYAIFRDIAFLVIVGYINFKFFTGIHQSYPFKTIAFIGLLYFGVFSTNDFSLLHRILAYFKDRYDSVKNRELFNLYQMFLNEYEQNLQNKERYQMEYLMADYKKYMKAIVPAMNVYLENSHRTPKRLAYDMFAREVGTKDAENIANILFEISESNSEVGHMMLENRYDEFKKRRQEQHKRKSKVRGDIVHLITFTGAYVVIISAMAVYYLMYTEQQSTMFNGF